MERQEIIQAFENSDRDAVAAQFADREKARDNLKLLESRIAAARDWELLLADIVLGCIESPDPGSCLNNFERFFASTEDPIRSAATLRDDQSALRAVTALFGFSQFLADVLIRYPEFLDWLAREDVLHVERSLANFRLEAAAAVGESRELIEVRDILCRWKRQQLLRIGARDILQLATVEQVTREISDLAQVLIERATQLAWDLTSARFGVPLTDTPEWMVEATTFEDEETSTAAAGTGSCEMCIIGMGKLGGRELNFSSDIDLIFIYEAEGNTSGETPDGRKVVRQTNHVFFTRMGEIILKFLSERSVHGNMFRVDMRLRPEGKDGPLVRSLESFVTYLTTQARDWERIAYLKGRVLAGPSHLAHRIYRITEQFVFSVSSPQRIVQEVKELKTRIDREVTNSDSYHREVKRGYGGIREIEFVVAAMQIVYGKTHRALHVRNIFLAIQRLKEVNLLTFQEMAFYLYAYEFLRMVEHRLQMAEEHQTHTLPSSGPELDVFARRAHFSGSDSFLAVYEQVTTRVHERFVKFFELDVEHVEREHEDLLLILDREAPQEAAVQALARYGIHEEQSLELLRDLAFGTREVFISAEGQRYFEQMLPSLLRLMSQAPAPAQVLPQLHSFMLAIKGITYYYEVIAKHPEILNLLVTLFGSSDSFSRSLIAHPEFFDALISSQVLHEFDDWDGQRGRIAAAIGGSRQFEKKLGFLRRAGMFETLLVALRFMAEIRTLEESLSDLSRTADNFVAVAMELVCWRVAERVGIAAGRERDQAAREIGKFAQESFEIIALGKYGGQELNFFGDLDIVFVSADEAELLPLLADHFSSVHEFYSHIADSLTHVLSENLEGGRVFLLDSRLRPHGRNAPLVAALGQYSAYLENEAESWELQAFTRARHVWGQSSHLAQLKDIVESRLDVMGSTVRPQVVSMRKKLEESVDDPGVRGREFKRGPGGIVDVEFLLQIVWMENPLFRAKGETNYFRLLSETSIPEYTVHLSSLRGPYHFLRSLESATRLVSGQGESMLPEDAGTRQVIARMLNLESGQQLERRIGQVKAEIRKVWDHFVGAEK